MDSPKTVIKIMNDNLYLFENRYEDININALKAAIAYKYLLHVYSNFKDVTKDQV